MPTLQRVAHPQRLRARARRSPLTKVPFADPRSSIVSRPTRSRAIAGVAAGELGSSLSFPLRSPPRPITSSFSRASCEPARPAGGDHEHLAAAGGRARTLDLSPLRGLRLLPGPARRSRSRTCRTVLPTLITSPSSSVRGASIRSSLTNVPLAEPRSSIVSCSSAPREIRAWGARSPDHRRACPRRQAASRPR